MRQYATGFADTLGDRTARTFKMDPSPISKCDTGAKQLRERKTKTKDEKMVSKFETDEELEVGMMRDLGEMSLAGGASHAERRSGAQKKAAPLSRPLGPIEHLFWLLDQNRSLHFAVTGQIAGKARHDAWRNALECLQARHPLLACYIDGVPGSVPFFRQPDIPAPIPLRIVRGDPRADWPSAVAEELAEPIDAGRAPLLRAILIEDARDCALTLVAHHAIADGLSLAHAIRDTLRSLAGRQLDPLQGLTSQEAMLGAIGWNSDPSGEDIEPTPSRPAVYRPLDGLWPTVSKLRLTPDLTRTLRAQARRLGTTVHGALMASVAIAGQQVFDTWRDERVRILSPISTRRLLGIEDDCGVFVGAATNTLDGRAEDFWELARRANAELAAGRSREAIASSLSAIGQAVGDGLDVAGAAEFARHAFAREALLTNLGELIVDQTSGGLRLEELWGPAVVSGMEGEQTIGVATLNGCMCFTHTSHSPSEGFLEAIRDILAEACQ